MARVTVQPEEFTFVEFDAGRITELAEEMAKVAGLGSDVAVVIDVDEQSPFGLVRTGVEPGCVTIQAESAAFEDARNPRHLSDGGTRAVLGRVLFRAADRLDPSFGAPPADAELTYQQQTAWDAYALGRCDRLGYGGQKPRRRYHFRIRHGFTDVADRVFERLWGAERLTWADIESACEETAAARPEGDDRTKRPASTRAR